MSSECVKHEDKCSVVYTPLLSISYHNIYMHLSLYIAYMVNLDISCFVEL